MKIKTADLIGPALLEAVEALEKMKASFEDLLNGYPERELHEAYQVTLNRADSILEKLNRLSLPEGRNSRSTNNHEGEAP